MNTSSYEQRSRAARERLRDALAPITPQERAALEHLFRCTGDLPTLETLALVAERALHRHLVDDQIGKLVGEAYDKGFAEGVEHGKAGGER